MLVSHFEPSPSQDNKNGWCPRLGIPDRYKDMPFSKLLEWDGGSNTNYSFQVRKYTSGGGKYAGGAGGSQYANLHDEEKSSFQLVGTTRTPMSIYTRGEFFHNQWLARGGQNYFRNSQFVPLRGVKKKVKENRMKHTKNKWNILVPPGSNPNQESCIVGYRPIFLEDD